MNQLGILARRRNRGLPLLLGATGLVARGCAAEGELIVLMARSFGKRVRPCPWLVVEEGGGAGQTLVRVPSVLALRMALCLRSSARRRASQGFS